MAERLKTRLLHHDSKSPNWRWLSAHNGEDVRSKLTAGIHSNSIALQKLLVATLHCNTKPLSWRAAYRRISPRQSRVRTFDGYLFLIKRRASDRYRWVVQTGMAQGKRAGLITPRSLDRNGLSVFYYFFYIKHF